jgi:hypothetical protein
MAIFMGQKFVFNIGKNLQWKVKGNTHLKTCEIKKKWCIDRNS